jgi:hypothetical protein
MGWAYGMLKLIGTKDFISGIAIKKIGIEKGEVERWKLFDNR